MNRLILFRHFKRRCRGRPDRMRMNMDILKKLGVRQINRGASTGQYAFGAEDHGKLDITSPATGELLASVYQASEVDYEMVISAARAAFSVWRNVPAPKRGEIVRQIGFEFRRHKMELGALVSLEMGKPLQEGWGEVQETIDICDFAVGQSRQLYGATMHSERPNHRMYDHYHPLGVAGIVTAFNFPVAVWSWNAMLAAVCGDVMVWKPSSRTPLSAIACQHIVQKVLKENDLPEGIFNLMIGQGEIIGEKILADERIPLVSITGSVRVGRHAAAVIAGRFGRSILELGGNNAIIVTPNANLELALPAIVFGAVGTAGQRCTTTRRLIVHESVYDRMKEALITAYQGLKIGNPLDTGNHVGPLVNRAAVDSFIRALERVVAEGGVILYGGTVLNGPEFSSGLYVTPTIVEAKNHYATVQEETFAPILYLIRYSGDISEAIALQNDVTQGLSSAIFTDRLSEAEIFLSAGGSDCGIANVNIGTSGAEIGGAFGGEKNTGGGRESGSDAWKAYMRRQTTTINFGMDLPLAQGIQFKI